MQLILNEITKDFNFMKKKSNTILQG